METGENLILTANENSSDHLTNNNNTIALNCSITVTTNDVVNTSAAPPNENGFDGTTESQSHGTLLAHHELIGSNRGDSNNSDNCDTETNDCDAKTILNNNDLAIGFVDDDDEAINGDIGANTVDNYNQCNTTVEATKGHANAIG